MRNYLESDMQDPFVQAAIQACQKAQVSFIRCINDVSTFGEDAKSLYILFWEDQKAFMRGHMWNVKGHTAKDFESWVNTLVSNPEWQP